MARSKALVVYYSRSGTTRALATAIAKTLQCEIDEIGETTSRNGVLGYLRSLVEAMSRRPSPIKPAKQDPGRYDLVIIGTPVWASSMSSPVRSYLMANKERLRATAFFCTLGGRGSDSAFAQMERLTGKPPRARCALRAAEIQSGRYEAEVARFAQAIKAMSPSPQGSRTAAGAHA